MYVLYGLYVWAVCMGCMYVLYVCAVCMGYNIFFTKQVSSEEIIFVCFGVKSKNSRIGGRIT